MDTVANPALSPARHALAEKIAAVEEATRRHDELDAPMKRLRGVASAADAARAKVDALRAADQESLANWMMTAGADDPRPEPSADLKEAETLLAVAERDARAANAALERLNEGIRSANDALQHAGAERDAVALKAVVQEEVTRLCHELHRRIQAAAEIDVQLGALAQASEGLGNETPTLKGTANAICSFLYERRGEAMTPTRGPAPTLSARQFLNRLRADAAATWG